MLVLIGPHVRKHEQENIWAVLQGHGLDPEPLELCPRAPLSFEQGRLLMAMLPESAPIKEPEEGQEYVLIRLRSTAQGARRFLEDALCSSVVGTARIPRWKGGEKQRRPVRLQSHPEALLREIVIVPDDTSAPIIEGFFVNHEDRGKAA